MWVRLPPRDSLGGREKHRLGETQDQRMREAYAHRCGGELDPLAFLRSDAFARWCWRCAPSVCSALATVAVYVLIFRPVGSRSGWGDRAQCIRLREVVSVVGPPYNP